MNAPKINFVENKLIHWIEQLGNGKQGNARRSFEYRFFTFSNFQYKFSAS